MTAGMEKKHVINFTPKERRRCLAIASKGRNKASMIRRAHILLKSDEGKTDRAALCQQKRRIPSALGCDA